MGFGYSVEYTPGLKIGIVGFLQASSVILPLTWGETEKGGLTGFVHPLSDLSAWVLGYLLLFFRALALIIISLTTCYSIYHPYSIL